MNTITLLGRATSSIELKQTQAGKSVASFSLAVKRPYTKDTTDFHTVVAWDKTAELLAKYVNKGNQVCIRGYLTNREWTDKNGNKRISTEIIAEEIDFVGSGSGTSVSENNTVRCSPGSVTESQREAREGSYMPSGYTSNNQNFETIPSDEGLPF